MSVHTQRLYRRLMPVASVVAAVATAAVAYAASPDSSTTAAAVNPNAGAVAAGNAAAAPQQQPAAAVAAQPAAKPSPAPSSNVYLGRIASSTGTDTSATATLTPASAAKAGSLLTVTILFTGASSGTPRVADSAGNAYRLEVNQADANGDDLLMYVAPGIKALNTSDVVTVTFPAASAHAIAVDAFAGYATPDQAMSATGSSTSASTGNTATTATAKELAVAAIGGVNGSAALTGYTQLPALALGNGANVVTGYRLLTSTGRYAGAGSSSSGWIAGVVTIS